MGIFKPKAYFWVGGQNKEIMVFSELLDNAKQLNFYPLKFSNHTGGAGATRLRGTHKAGATL
jgi:hypothetical protein